VVACTERPNLFTAEKMKVRETERDRERDKDILGNKDPISQSFQSALLEQMYLCSNSVSMWSLVTKGYARS
jgi:hypothetical protein